jgi:CheY-like chemotaxis protein
LTSRLLAFARRQPLQSTTIDVNRIVENTTKLLSRTLVGSIAIGLKLGDAIWPVVADPAQLEASIINIATNARDAMPNGGKLLITTSSRELNEDYSFHHQGLKPGDYSLIEISDTGTGMSPEVLTHIFEPFYTTKEEGKGTGLGLSMVFGFMKQSGGHIDVYSEVGSGTTFRLYLPRSVLLPVPTADRIAHLPHSTSVTETVLVVEDNPRLRLLVVRQVSELGYGCVEAADGPSALAVLERESIDLLFSDIIMPGGMSGYELSEKARSRWPQLKILLTSGFPKEKFATAEAAPSGIELLSKPYRKADLAAALRRALDETSSPVEETVDWTVGQA